MYQDRKVSQQSEEKHNNVMGICTSCESTAVATAKLILEDGGLQEFSYPVRVSYVLQKNPACFVSSSDDLDIGSAVLPVADDEELQLGQLYFLLPLSLLKHLLQPAEMAALAVKASSALQRSYCGDSRRNHVLVFTAENSRAESRKMSGGGEVASRRRRGGGAGSRGNISPRLSAIPELGYFGKRN